MAGTIQAAGYTAEVVRRKNMRNIRLRVKPDGSVQVSAPFGVPNEELRRILVKRAGWVAEQKERVAQSARAKADAASGAEQRAWRVVVEASVAVLLKKWEPAMGVRVKKLAFRNMKSRWGSCQPATGRVCINTRLALYPPRCLEYVVVHELAHMLEPSHNARFKAILSEYLPDWKESEKLLRE